MEIVQRIKNKKEENNFKLRIKNFVSDANFSLIIAIVLICIVMSILSPYFLTIKNFLNIGLYAAIVGIMAAGLTVSMLMGAFDLSQYSVATLAGIAVAVFSGARLPAVILVLIGFSVGIICGTINSILINIFRINPIIATMGMMMVYRSICYIVTSSKILYFSDNFFNFMGRGYFLGVPLSLWMLAVVYAIVAFILKYTAFGRKVFAVGANPNASFLAGISLKKVRTGGLLVSSISASIAGMLIVSQVGAAIPASGVGSELDIAASVLLGGLSLTGGKGKLSGTFLGLLVLVIIGNGMTLLSVQSYYQMLVRGTVLILAVLIDSIRGGGYK